VTPERLRAWLDAGCDDEGRPVVLLDTRNAFERDLGSFADCVDFRIGKFSEFAPAVEEHAADFAGQTVVTFCTGGIRCEKAALLMQDCGIEHVYQLEGGILEYFEQVGAAHYQGGCFVFDEREVLGSDLRPSDGAIAPPAAPQHR
jgi:Predicted sulfurtransferase